MELDHRKLTTGERMTLRQLVKAKAAGVTVREAREHVAPTGRSFVWQVVGVTLLSLVLAAVFLPFLVVALAAPFWLPLQQRRKRERWATLLPIERDAEPFTLTA